MLCLQSISMFCLRTSRKEQCGELRVSLVQGGMSKCVVPVLISKQQTEFLGAAEISGNIMLQRRELINFSVLPINTESASN